MLSLLALNQIGATDLWFFIICGVIVGVAIAVYFLIPVFNKKQYQEQRDNLKKREASFKANMQTANGSVEVTADATPTYSEVEQAEQSATEQSAE